jgi:uncharacterized membrane protein YfcA
MSFIFEVPDNFEWQFQLVLFVSSFVAELWGCVVGGGSFLTIPVLTGVLGLPLQQALLIDDASTIGMEAGVLTRRWRDVCDNWRLVLFRLMPPITIGGIMGTYLLLTVPVIVIKILMIIALVALLYYSFNRKRIDKTHPKNIKPRNGVLFGVLLIIGLYNNFIGPGEGTFTKLALMTIMGVTLLESHGVKTAAMIPIRIFALVVAIVKGFIIWPYLLVMLLATFLAGWVATKYIVEMVSERIMRWCLAIVGIFFTVFMLFAY